MGKLGRILLFFLGLVFIAAVALFILGKVHPKRGGIFIETTPASEVYIDGVKVGNSPHEAVLDPGEISVKLVPQGENLLGYETKVDIVSNVQTVIKREFGQSDNDSSGEIASFEKVSGKETSVSIVTIPDLAEIYLDGKKRAYAPYKIDTITPGEHQLKIAAPGYKERIFNINPHQGYKLTVVVKLAAGGLPPPVPTPISLFQGDIVYNVEILSTPNNFLRVRSLPSTEGKEVARVESGKKYPLMEEDEKSGWFKIEYEKGKEGWVSNEYSKKVEE